VAPPGVVLAGLLEDIDIETVSGHDTVQVLCAEYRQVCRQQARFYRAVLETGLRKPFSISTVQRVTKPGEFAAEEARAALVWSRARAERAFGFAVDIFCRLPLLGDAMLAGELDEPRARAFIDWTAGLTDAQAATVCDQLLPEAPGLMVGELIDRIKRACLAIDPDWAEKRYRAAVRTRRVQGSRNPDGTANLGGYQQPVDRIAAAAERIDSLARACKHAGDRRGIDLIRSDLFLGMTDGTFEGMAEDQIVAYVLAHPYLEPDDIHDTSEDTDGGGGSDDGKPGSSGGGWPGGSSGGKPGGSGDDGGEPGDTAGDRAGPAAVGQGSGNCTLGSSTRRQLTGDNTPGEVAPGDDTRGRPTGGGTPGDGASGEAACGGIASSGGEPTSERLTDSRPADWEVVDEPAPSGSTQLPNGAGSPAMAARSATRWAASEIRVELGTLLGLDEHPGEIPPWGYLPAARARRLVADMHTAEWRYVLSDPSGRAITGGLIRARPATSGEPAQRDPRRGGIVEIAVPVDQLARITAAQPPRGRWQPVLVELARHAEQRGRDPDTDTRDTSRRAPGAVLRRWIEMRDRQCVHPCCRAPARTTDQDHRVGYALGGPTIGANLSTPCRHDHRLKDEGGWTMRQPEPGITVWTSPLGHRYESRRLPVIPPMPEPYPDDLRRLDEPVGLYAWTSRPAGCERDDSCDCEPQILPPVPTRAPRNESAPEPKPSIIFDPNETFPF